MPRETVGPRLLYRRQKFTQNSIKSGGNDDLSIQNQPFKIQNTPDRVEGCEDQARLAKV